MVAIEKVHLIAKKLSTIYCVKTEISFNNKILINGSIIHRLDSDMNLSIIDGNYGEINEISENTFITMDKNKQEGKIIDANTGKFIRIGCKIVSYRHIKKNDFTSIIFTTLNNKTGVLNQDLEIIVKPEYRFITLFNSKNDLELTKENYFFKLSKDTNSKKGIAKQWEVQDYGAVGVEGNIIFDCIYENIQINDNYILALKNNKIYTYQFDEKIIHEVSLT